MKTETNMMLILKEGKVLRVLIFYFCAKHENIFHAQQSLVPAEKPEPRLRPYGLNPNSSCHSIVLMVVVKFDHDF